MPPQQLNDGEMSVLMSLAGPIEHQRRPQFLQEVAQELEAKRQAGEVGKGSVHRLASTIQRKYFDPPQLPNASPVHRGSAARGKMVGTAVSCIPAKPTQAFVGPFANAGA
jgi:hypothetical protein